ncbi:hypothetical protein Tco_0942739 [Tanacetum coccineum]
MPYLLSQFISLNLHSSKSIVAANGDYVPLPDIGLVDTPFVVSSDVYYIPCLTMNLASVSKICDSGYDVKYSISDCSIYDRKTQEVVGTSSIGALGKLDAYDISDFSGCKLAKFSALPFSNSVSSSNALFDLVMCGDLLLYDFLTVFKEFRALVKTQHLTVIECLRCDLRGEYTSNDFVGLLKSDGTIYHTSCMDTPL